MCASYGSLNINGWIIGIRFGSHFWFPRYCPTIHCQAWPRLVESGKVRMSLGFV